MKIDAHYYAVLTFCRACGFKKEIAYKIAHACQFVDDARINHIVLKEQPSDIECVMIEDKPSFYDMATCHSYYKIKTFNYCSMVNNTCAFHFVPGCSGENFSRKLRSDEKSPVILQILVDALEEDDPVKIGMVLHAYLDTFSHQGFSGILSKVNDIKECDVLSKIHHSCSEKLSFFIKSFSKDKFDKVLDWIPAYGHGQAREYPDLPYLKWKYKYDYTDEFSEKYLYTEIDNKLRYREAFEKVKEYLECYLKKHPELRDENVEFDKFNILFDILIAEKPHKERVSEWYKVLIEQRLLGYTEINKIKYDENKWLKEAFKDFRKKKFSEHRVENVELSDNFANSNWYRFYLAVKWYKKRFFEYCHENGVDIPR